jgi:hypothetical protein
MLECDVQRVGIRLMVELAIRAALYISRMFRTCRYFEFWICMYVFFGSRFKSRVICTDAVSNHVHLLEGRYGPDYLSFYPGEKLIGKIPTWTQSKPAGARSFITVDYCSQARKNVPEQPEHASGTTFKPKKHIWNNPEIADR